MPQPTHVKTRGKGSNFENMLIVYAELFNSFLFPRVLCCCSICAMSALYFLGLVSYLNLFTAVDSDVICQNFKFVVDEDVVYNHILEGHVFKRLTVYSAAQCHVMCKDYCLCSSINYFPVSKGNNCELNDVNKEMEPAALQWKQGVNYYDLARSYTVKVS